MVDYQDEWWLSIGVNWWVGVAPAVSVAGFRGLGGFCRWFGGSLVGGGLLGLWIGVVLG